MNNLGRVRAPKPGSLKFSVVLRRRVVGAKGRERCYKYVYARNLGPAGAVVYTIIRVPFRRAAAAARGDSVLRAEGW